MAKKEVLDAVFFKDSKKPKCPDCLYGLNELDLSNYGVEEDKLFFVAPCKKCGTDSKYFTNEEDFIIKTKIVERKLM